MFLVLLGVVFYTPVPVDAIQGGPDCVNNSTCGIGRGYCDQSSGLCVCASSSYTGYNTCLNNTMACPSTCVSSVGSCDDVTGKCTCNFGLQGVDCDVIVCPLYLGVECGGQGRCNAQGVCRCNIGWVGSACNFPLSANGMTSGDLAGAVIGGLLIAFGLLIAAGLYAHKRGAFQDGDGYGGDDDDCECSMDAFCDWCEDTCGD
jgi:EGF-like domain